MQQVQQLSTVGAKRMYTVRREGLMVKEKGESYEKEPSAIRTIRLMSFMRILAELETVKYAYESETLYQRDKETIEQMIDLVKRMM